MSNKKYLQNLQKGWEAYKHDELVTVAIPARNEEACIERCVRSLLKQSHTNLQILILDDASADSTRSIA
ncbi:MAG: glycosyltransferase, partial [Spirochaetia bacterium]|nr:glycosyltransferase [Spirochaetia bacterium]